MATTVARAAAAFGARTSHSTGKFATHRCRHSKVIIAGANDAPSIDFTPAGRRSRVGWRRVSMAMSRLDGAPDGR